MESSDGLKVSKFYVSPTRARKAAEKLRKGGVPVAVQIYSLEPYGVLETREDS